MWGQVSRRKWRPTGNMYSTELHVALRLYAKEQLMSMQSYTSESGKRELKATGKALSADGARSQDKRVAVLMICEVIPPAAVKKLFGDHMPSVSEVESEVQSRMRYLDPQGIKQCVDSYIRLFSKIKDKGISLDDWSVWRSNQYLAELQEEALQKYQPGRGAVKDGLVDAKHVSDAGNSDDDTAAAPQQHDPEELAGRARSGHTAAMRARGNLVRLEQHFGFPVHMRSASLPIWEGELPLSVKHATPVSPFALRKLQDFVANPKSPVYAVNIGGSFLASNLGAVRTKQLQHAKISRKSSRGGIARGQARYAKDPKSRGKPQGVAIYKRGVAGCERWFHRWRRTVRDVEQAEWAYRDFNGSDPFTATRFENIAMPKHKINKVLRLVLQRACNMTPDEARRITYHSGRSFLPTCSKARGEPMSRQLELGAWCGSKVAFSDADPHQAKQLLQQLKRNETPARYSESEAVRLRSKIIEENCEAVYVLTQSSESHRPNLGGFDLLCAYDDTERSLSSEGRLAGSTSRGKESRGVRAGASSP